MLREALHGQLHHRLAGGDHLPGFGQGLDDSAIGVCEQHRISGFVSRDIGLSGGGAQLRGRGVEGDPGLPYLCRLAQPSAASWR